jgi:hypothetical protein
VGRRDRRADLGDQDAPQPLLRPDQPVAQLADAVDAELRVIRQFPALASNARRAAAIARSMSAGRPSAATPATSSVAGLIASNVRPPSAPVSSSSMSIRSSPASTPVPPSVAVVVMKELPRRASERTAGQGSTGPDCAGRAITTPLCSGGATTT